MALITRGALCAPNIWWDLDRNIQNGSDWFSHRNTDVTVADSRLGSIRRESNVNEACNLNAQLSIEERPELYGR